MRPSALLRNPLLMQRVGQLGEYLRFDGALREGRRPLDMDADFTMVSWVLNVAHTPPEPAPGIAPLPPLPR